MLPDNIRFSDNPRSTLKEFLETRRYSAVIALVDENTKTHCLPLIGNLISDVICVPSGEDHKTLATCERIWDQMTDLHLDRHAALIVIGGGVLGDMGGFCAATYKRGIDFVLVPTTLLAQVDASIGGKLGVDFRSFKNHIGVFKQPALTLLCPLFLQTLSERELRSGFAEVIKHCLISDRTMWEEITTKSLADQDWDKLIKHSVMFKARITTEDPTEKGLRKILNAGHTIGHAVESFLLARGSRILHGEAIAIGLIAEAYIAHGKKMLSDDDLMGICRGVSKFFGKEDLSETDAEAISHLALQDKKNRDNRILCVLQDGIGKARWDIEIGLNEITAALKYYQALQM